MDTNIGLDADQGATEQRRSGVDVGASEHRTGNAEMRQPTNANIRRVLPESVRFTDGAPAIHPTALIEHGAEL